MRKIIYILLFIISYTAYSQSLSVFNVDVSNFPTVKAKFIAFDVVGNQITNLNPSDFEVKENGQPRVVTNVSCEDKQKLIALSSVLVFDISISMSWGPPRIQSAKDAANAWIDGLPLGTSECALVSFTSYSVIVKDFTTNRQLLKNGISGLNAGGGTDYNQALLDPPCGGLQVANRGKYKKVIVFLTDGLSVFEPKTAEIIDFAKMNNITIYAVTLDMPAPQCIKDMTEQTGGVYFENITTQKEAEDTYTKLLNTAQGGAPCQIEWTSGVSCVSARTNVELKLIPNNLKSNKSYQSPNSSVAKLEIIPSSLKFKNAIPGIKRDSTITVTARNADFNISNITSSNSAYTISPTSFFLTSGQSQNLTISYVPADSGYTYTKFTIENDKCAAEFYASGGYPGKKAKIKTLNLIQPNGGETFVVGMDTLITWEGVLPEEQVKIQYTTNNGANWILISENATGLSYNWLVPKTPSNLCLARVIAKLGYESTIKEVQICNQIWMGCNLDVETYRDGTPIPEVKDSTEWSKLKTGAWCYFNNDPAMGAIYGKLYNWYAVNDPRGLAPEGWHLPTDLEWYELSDCLGGDSIAGRKLKSTGTIEDGDGLWYSPNTGTTNESGFSALPGSYRSNLGGFGPIGYWGFWWSSTERPTYNVWFRTMQYSDQRLERYYDVKTNGHSVRCVKD